MRNYENKNIKGGINMNKSLKEILNTLEDGKIVEISFEEYNKDEQ